MGLLEKHNATFCGPLRFLDDLYFFYTVPIMLRNSMLTVNGIQKIKSVSRKFLDIRKCPKNIYIKTTKL